MYIQRTMAELLILTPWLPSANDSFGLKLKAIWIHLFWPVPCAAVTIDLPLQDQLTVVLEN